MKRLVAFVIALTVALPGFAREASTATSGQGATVSISTSSATNATAMAVSGPSQAALIQCDVAAYYLAVTSAAGVVTSSTGFLLSAGQLWPITINSSHPYIAFLAVSGTGTCKIALVD